MKTATMKTVKQSSQTLENKPAAVPGSNHSLSGNSGKEQSQPTPAALEPNRDNQTATQKSSGTTKTISNVLGEITWLMTQSLNHRYFFISDLEWMILQPVSLGQFRIFHGEKFPVGAAFWAFVDETVEERLQKGITKMKPGDWKSGERLWLIDLISPFGSAQKMIDDLTDNVFPDKTFKYLQRNEEGNLVVMASRKRHQNGQPKTD